MDNVFSWLIAILICHQIMTIWTYLNLLKEDRGIDTSPKSNFLEFVQSALLMCPMFLNAIYDLTLGLVDHFREKRLCKMLVARDDEIKQLREENTSLKKSLSIRKAYEDHLHEVYSSDWYTKEMPRPSLYDFMKYHDFDDNQP